MSSSLKINSMQMNMIDSNRLSGGIQQYMEDEDYSYNQAVMAVLKNEGWTLRNVGGVERYKEFYNTESGEVATGVWHKKMMVPVTDDPFVTNAFRVRTNGIHSWVEPNEWQTPYDCRKGQRMLKKNQWRRKMNEKTQKSNMGINKEHVY